MESKYVRKKQPYGSVLYGVLVYFWGAGAVVYASPFPPYPITMQTYINEARPNLMLQIDNSATMKTKVPSRLVNLPAKQRPQRIDVVKHAAINMVNKYYNDFNWGVSVHRDKYRTLNWSVDPNATTGYNLGDKVNGTVKNPDSRTLVGTEERLPGKTTAQYNKFGSQLIFPITKNNGSVAQKNQIIKALATMSSTSPDVAYLEDAYPSLVDYMVNPIEYRCQSSFIIVLTDGNRVNLSVNKKAAGKYSYTDAKTWGIDGDGESFNKSDFPNQYIKSSAIGIGTNGTGFKNFTNAGDGFYALANSVEDVFEQLEDFIQRLRPGKKLFLPDLPSVSSSIDRNSKRLVAELVLDPTTWSSKLQFLKFDKNGVLEENPVSARYNSPDGSDDKVVVASTPKGIIELTSGIGDLKAADFGLPSGQDVSKFVSWLVGGDKFDSETGYRVRAVMYSDERRQIGDSINSPIVMIGETSDLISAPEFLAYGSNDGMFKIYRVNPDVGSKIVEQITDPETGVTESVEVVDEAPYVYQFAYMPGMAKLEETNSTLMKAVAKRADQQYGRTQELAHVYGVNGGIFYRTTDKGHSFLVSNLGQGGKAAFALSVGGTHHSTGATVGLDASRSAWKNSVPLWDTSTESVGKAYAGSQDMGYTVGSPAIGRVALVRELSGADSKPVIRNGGDVRYSAFVSTGYHGNDSGPSLYIYDALGVNDVGGTATSNGAGGLITKLTYLDKDLKYKSSLSTPTLVDLDYDGVADIAYAGDQNGNLYRFDFRGATPEDWTTKLIYKGNSDQPITSAPAFSNFGGKNVVIFGTGSELYENDVLSKKGQSVIGIFDDLKKSDAIGVVGKSDLLEQTLKESTEGGGRVRDITNNPMAKAHKGWIINLGDDGESVVASPQVLNGTLLFTTKIVYRGEYAPSGAVCFKPSSADAGWIMSVNARTGGLLTADDTRYKDFVKKDGSSYAGQFSPNLSLSQVQLVYLNDSPLMSFDGQFLSSNKKDYSLGNYPLKPTYEERLKASVEAYITQGLEVIRKPFVPGKVPPPEPEGKVVTRLSWRMLFE